MEPQQIATSLLTATTLVLAGSSFLIGQLQQKVSESLDDNAGYNRVIYMATAGGFLSVILTAFFSLSVIMGPVIFPPREELFIDLAVCSLMLAISFPSIAASSASLVLYKENK
jgi:hypothetical protein